MQHIPEALHGRPFTTQDARRAGVTPDELRGPRFRRLHRGVYVAADAELDFAMHVEAARLALPADAKLSHESRLRMAGLDIGTALPLHFTVARDLHVTPSNVFLHRTRVMPPTDDDGVTAAAAFVGIAAHRRLLDLIGIGDWLLHHDLISAVELTELGHRQAWRPGARDVLAAAPHLNGRAASIPESETRAVLAFAGLPVPEVNVPVSDSPDGPIADLYYRRWRLALEYEGRHHLRDAAQIKRDAWRYGWMREADIEYIQIYAEMLAHPLALVTHVHQVLVRRGYDGPPPRFGRKWNSLFAPARTRAVG